MPEIEIQHVVSCSSADKNNPAENLLKAEGAYKWKCASAGEKNPSVVLQLSKSSKINSIDIGNEGSAFVEILVGKATAAADQDFEVLLVASSFMTPLESRNGTNRNGVRMFGPEKLNKTVASENWDRVKIVCTQPFSKTSQYGLSFVKFHSPPSSSSDNSESKVKKFGAFSLKDDDDDDNIHVGSLFASRSKPVTTGAAAIREATRLADEQVKKSSPPHKISSPFVENSSKVKPPLKPPPERKEEQRKRPAEYSPPHHSKAKMAKSSHDDSDTDESQRSKVKKQSTESRDEKQAAKKVHTESVKARPSVVFSKIMSKVTFVMSGFQNPTRGQLRDQAMEMGAKYRSDWGPGCTHLVCAFTNTPKYQQVSGKGRIVKKNWVVDSYRKKELQPWKKYRLGDAESPDESSDSDKEDTRARDKVKMRARDREDTREREDTKAKDREETKDRDSSRPSQETKIENTPGSISSKKDKTKKAPIQFEDSDSDSGGDTEDELRKVREYQEREKLKASSRSDVEENKEENDGKDNEEMYDKSTDEDEPQQSAEKDSDSDSGFPDLPDFFTDKNFFFYGEFPTGEQRLLTRYIAAYNGQVEEYMSKRVKYVITGQKWDDNFEEALTENPELVFVKPKWITSCHSKLKLLPYQPYIVVPT